MPAWWAAGSPASTTWPKARSSSACSTSSGSSPTSSAIARSTSGSAMLRASSQYASMTRVWKAAWSPTLRAASASSSARRVFGTTSGFGL